jgi:serine/threonine protein kinase
LITTNIDGEILAKIADLGTAAKLAFDVDSLNLVDNSLLLQDVVGTRGYTAPEVLHPVDVRYAYPADVFSVAIVLWELFFKVDEQHPVIVNPLSSLNADVAYQQV